ncbi:MAG: radical SAM protein [Thermacetogeniaceae bacterium]
MCIGKRIFLVEGVKKHCIYNLNDGALYSITDDVFQVIKRLRQSEAAMAGFDEEEREIVQVLLSEDIISPSLMVEENDSISAGDTGGAAAIDFAWIEVTDRCNLACVHCYNSASRGRGKDMLFDHFQLVVSELKRIGVDKIQFIGGEPLLHQDLRRMIAYSRDHFSFLEVFTNGTLVNSNWSKIFKEYNVNVAVSVYSYDTANHEKVTGSAGSHAKTNAGLRLLKENGVPYRISCIRMAGIDVGRRNTELYDLSLRQGMVRLSGRASSKLLDKELVKKRAITKNTFSRPVKEEFFKTMINLNNCFSRTLYIAADLDVYPCVMERRLRHGNLQDASLAAILKREIMMLSKDKIETCHDCEYRYACFDCRPDSLEKGVYDKPWYCTYDPYSGEWQRDMPAL